MPIRIPLFNAYVGSTPPASPVNGTLWIDTTKSESPVLKTFVNGSWIAVKPETSSSGTTPPASPSVGELWVDTSVSPPVLKIWNGSIWQEVGPVTISSGEPHVSTRRTGQVWVDISSNPPSLKVWDGSRWVTLTATVPEGSYLNVTAADADKVDGFHASQTPTPNTIPVANSAGKVSLGWIPQGSGSGLDADTVDGFDSRFFIALATIFGE